MENILSYDKHKDFTTLDAWKKARLVKLFFYREVIKQLPLDERFNLNSQIRRASISVTANISEGYGRYHDQEATRFYRIARGSMYELKDHLASCYDLGFICRDTLMKGISLIENAKITLNGYIKFVQARKKITDEEAK